MANFAKGKAFFVASFAIFALSRSPWCWLRRSTVAVTHLLVIPLLITPLACTTANHPQVTAPTTALAAAPIFTAANTITPGALWPDDHGDHIQAHGGGVIQLGDTFYWYGEQRARNLDRSKHYVSCYSSKDLIHWTFRNNVLALSDPFNFGPHWALERPKVYYNAPTKKYVMYMHIDGPLAHGGGGYDAARVGVAICDTPDGNYTYLRSFRPLGDESRDIGQFVDDDGSAYLIFEDRPTGGFHIAQLSDDFLDVKRETAFIHEPFEGGTLVHYKDRYYCVASHMTGWDANPDMYASAPKLEGPWSEFKNIAPPWTRTYGSQSTMLLKVTGTKTTTVIFMADIWRPWAQWDSRYLWMPLEIDGDKLHLPEPRAWTIDVHTGEAWINPNAPAMPIDVPRRRTRPATTRATTRPATARGSN